MSKKKAIKIAAATAIAASSFAAVAPLQADAATTVSQKVKAAKATMKKPFTTYSTSDKYVSTSTVKKQIAAAEKAYEDIVKVVDKSKLTSGTKKKHKAALKGYLKYIKYAKGYNDGAVASHKAAKDLKADVEALNALVEADKLEDVVAQLAKIKAGVEAANKAIKSTVVGAKAEKVLMNQKTAPVTELVEKFEADNAEFLAGPAKVESVSAITNTKIDVTLKEEMSVVSAKKFTVEGLTVLSATLSADGKTVRLVTSKQDAGKQYTVKSGDTSASWIALVEDTTKPEVSTVTALTNNIVQVDFVDTDATEASILNPANYSINNGLTVSKVEYVVDANGEVEKDKVYLYTSAQVGGTVYTLTVSNVEDESENKVDSTKTKQFAGKSADTTAPTLVNAVSSKGNKVTLTFNDASQLDAATIGNVSNYSISGLTVTGVEVVSNPLTPGNKTVVLSTSNQTPGTVYKVVASGIKDVFGNLPTSNLEFNFAGTSLDTTPPSLTTVTSASNTKVAVVFNDELDEATATNIANYTISGLTVTGAELDKSDSTDPNYKKRVYLTTSAQTPGTVYKLSVKDVKDSSGNAITTNQTYEMQFAGKAADTAKPTVQSVSVEAGNKVKITFTDASDLDEATVKTLTNYSFDGGLGYPTSASYSKATKTVTLTTAKQTAGKVYKVTINNIKDVAGNVLEANTQRTFAGIGASLDPLSLESVVALNNRQIQVTFNNDVDNSTVAKTDFSLKQGSGSFVNFDTLTGETLTRIDAKTYILTLPVANALVSDVYTLQVNNSDSSISDLGGRALVTTDATKAERTFGGVTTAPVAAQVTVVSQVSANVIDVYFDKEVAVDAMVNVNTVSVNDTVNTRTATAVVRDSADKKKVRITLDGSLAGEKIANLTFANLAKITDVTGNIQLAPSTTGGSTFVKAFGTVSYTASTLQLSSAVGVDEQTVELSFNQDIVFNSGNPMTSITDANFLEIKNGDGTSISGADYDLTYAEQTAPNKVRVYFKKGTKLEEGKLYQVVIANHSDGDAKFTTLDGDALEVNGNATRGTAVFGFNNAEVAAPELVSVVPLSDDTVRVTFSKSLATTPTTDGTSTSDIEFYNGTDKIAISKLGAFTDVSNGEKRVFTVKLTDGKFLSGTTYTAKLPSTLTITDKYGVDTIKKSGTSDVTVSFGGAAAAATAPTASDLRFIWTDDATPDFDNEAFVSTAGLAQNSARTLEVFISSTAPTASTTAEFTYDLTGAGATLGTATTLTKVGTPTIAAGDKVYYRYVDQAYNKSAWVEDGTIAAASTVTLNTNTYELGNATKFTVASAATAALTVDSTGTAYTTALANTAGADTNVISIVNTSGDNITYTTFTWNELVSPTLTAATKR
ncbi:Ig-like domain-containing protein [Bacillus sp. 31A1R]|uniref:Ig-like domain-containing protein n=1 Tax=Robertmurraya mangrovi TaxID=3098077 RepID=A0ABU5IXJ2_9BACI|nr:Ig-like domain-containing protein [Bacillus sp. 31A1R]MDZ5471875.1 Ig-like domain-containing protein [Bacillus sp. 31A1R]